MGVLAVLIPIKDRRPFEEPYDLVAIDVAFALSIRSRDNRDKYLCSSNVHFVSSFMPSPYLPPQCATKHKLEVNAPQCYI